MAATPVSAHQDFASRVLKVNHAGEHGAVNIYRGQIVLARLTAPRMVAELLTFKGHEEGHRAIFLAELSRRGLPRCRSYWLCGLGGFVLGLVTGAAGRSAIAATTVAVERVVLRHLAHQLIMLEGRDEAAAQAVRAIVLEERAHHDQAGAHLARDRSWTRHLSTCVAASTEAVIWIGMRL